ncbi:hypothetical protein QAD02_001073 [Eretmocerus hayati]|uniref:Uncharacterized protein n=1 Tax=Eretmocerus hayati TaxID=131215 RepID=A0ACC2NHJ9_9HYME|nr:hypothetical protein QAD02_001073 [Eretmocerus hayati]
MTETRIMLGNGKMGTLETLNCDLRSIEWWESYSEWASRNTRLVEPQPRLEIAIIRLLKRVVFNANVGPAIVPFDMIFPERERLSVSLTGWTTTDEGYVLKTAAVEMLPPSSFQALRSTYHIDRAVQGNLLIVETELKLGLLDEGGPLLYNGNILMGLNHWSGRRCGHRKRQFLIKSTYYKDFLRFYLFGHE